MSIGEGDRRGVREEVRWEEEEGYVVRRKRRVEVRRL